jgi:predicted Zn-dependent protease
MSGEKQGPTRAIEQLHKTIERGPTFISSHRVLSLAYASCGEFDRALAAAQEAVALSGNNRVARAVLAYVLGKAGRMEDARKILADLAASSETDYASPVFVAAAYGMLGDKDRAFAELEKAYQDRLGLLPYLRVHPVFEPLRSDPRYRDLLHRMNRQPEARVRPKRRDSSVRTHADRG